MKGFLITYRKTTGMVKVQTFPSLAHAVSERLQLDRGNHSPNVEIVAVASHSMAHLRQSHRRYFHRQSALNSRLDK